jgi:outer membrane biosynthesis protein TonB
MRIDIEFNTDTATEKDYQALLAVANGLAGQPAAAVYSTTVEEPSEYVSRRAAAEAEEPEPEVAEEPKPKAKAKKKTTKPKPKPVDDTPEPVDDTPEPDDEPKQSAMERATELLTAGKNDVVKAALDELGAGRVRELDAEDEAKFLKIVEGE